MKGKNHLLKRCLLTSVHFSCHMHTCAHMCTHEHPIIITIIIIIIITIIRKVKSYSELEENMIPFQIVHTNYGVKTTFPPINMLK